MESKCPVDEEPYEVSLDNHGCQDGPKTGRLVALNKVSLVITFQKLKYKTLNKLCFQHYLDEFDCLFL